MTFISVTSPPGIDHTNDFLITTQIWWKICIAVTITCYLIATKFCTWHDSTAVVSCAKFCNDQLIGIWIRIKRNPSNFNFCGKIVSETDPWSAISECHPGWDSFWQRWYCDNRGYETILIRIGQAMQGETCAMFWIYSLKKYMLNLYHRLVAPSLEKLACTLHIF